MKDHTSQEILALLTRPMRRSAIVAAIPHRHWATVGKAIQRLKQAGCIRRIRVGVWVKTGKPYTEPRQPTRSPAVMCAEYFGISRQHAHYLIGRGEAYQTADGWERTPPMLGRPKKEQLL